MDGFFVYIFQNERLKIGVFGIDPLRQFAGGGEFDPEMSGDGDFFPGLGISSFAYGNGDSFEFSAPLL